MNKFIEDLVLVSSSNDMDTSLVRITSIDMELKLKQKREKDRRGGWWEEDFTLDELQDALSKHFSRAVKDPSQWIDVANFAAMAHVKTNYLGQKYEVNNERT